MLVVISMSIVIPFTPEYLPQPFVDFAFLVIRNTCDQILVSSTLPDLLLPITPFFKNHISALRTYSSSVFVLQEWCASTSKFTALAFSPIFNYPSFSLQKSHLILIFTVSRSQTPPSKFPQNYEDDSYISPILPRPVNKCNHARKTFWLLIKTQDFIHASKTFS